MGNDLEKNIFSCPAGTDIAWCPGCGNYSLHKIITAALSELGLAPKDVVISSGIGQAAKMPQYVSVNYYNGLHGRAMPVATAVKMANPELTVIAEGGDGDMYGEGGNHFMHNIRRNPDITHVVHNNMVYGLTKGQGSPTSMKGMKTNVQVDGVYLEPFNPLAVAISLGATFVARVFTGNMEHTKDVIKEAIKHKGYALVDVFHPCPSFNKVNTFSWYKENTYILSNDYDSSDKMQALSKSLETGKFPLGIIYKEEGKLVMNESMPPYKSGDSTPLYKRRREPESVEKLLLSE